MNTISVQILNPKAKRLLQDLAGLKLISISKDPVDSFFSIVRKLRLKKAKITLDEITREVEEVRLKRYEKKI